MCKSLNYTVTRIEQQAWKYGWGRGNGGVRQESDQSSGMYTFTSENHCSEKYLIGNGGPTPILPPTPSPRWWLRPLCLTVCYEIPTHSLIPSVKPLTSKDMNKCKLGWWTTKIKARHLNHKEVHNQELKVKFNLWPPSYESVDCMMTNLQYPKAPSATSDPCWKILPVSNIKMKSLLFPGY